MNKTYSFDEAFSASNSYFNNDELAAKVFLDKYALRDREQNLLEATPDDMHHRMAREFARIEKDKFANPMSESFIYSLFENFRYIIPQGSPMFGIGNNFQTISLGNCYVVKPPADSYGGILKADQEIAQICKRRGGVGTDISHIRPFGAETKNAARTSTGIIPFMTRFSNTIREVGQEGRRGALMLTISVHHPEIERYAMVKLDPKMVTGANISIRLSNEFLNAVEQDLDYEQRWPVDSKTPVISQKVNARKVWKTIIASAHKRAEPGLLFWDNIINNNACDCYADLGFATVSTNPCSELPLPANDSCRLLVQNLFSYVRKPFTKEASFDFALFREHVEIAQRLMDDMIDLEIEKIYAIMQKIELDPEAKEIKAVELAMWKSIVKMCIEGRRTGTGIVGEGDMLAALGLKYASPESIVVVEQVHKEMLLSSFRSSMLMARELGAFPIWDWKREAEVPFMLQIKKLDPQLYADIAKYGRRNIANLTIAPTGSLSLLTQTTSGIEPLFKLEPYTRRKKINDNDKGSRVDFVDAMGDKWQEFQVYHPKVKMWMEITGETDLKKSPWYGCCAEDLDWVKRVELQAVAQKYIDHAISSTLNLPENVSEESVAKIYEAAWKMGCKGITVYRKNCRSGVLIDNPVEKKPDVDDYVKRPSILNGDVFHNKVKNKDYFVIVGLRPEGKPYEVFAGRNGFLPKNITNGQVEKLKRGHYRLMSEGKTVVPSITAHIEEDEEALTRMISTSLRHGVDTSYVVTQLGKVQGDMQCLAKSIARSLKRYVKNGTAIKGDACPGCGSSEIIFQDGCSTCKSCGASKCG